MPTKNVAVVSDEPLDVTQYDTSLDEIASASEGYSSEFRAEDLTVPRISVLQDGSKQIKKTHPQYSPVPGGEAGKFLNSVTDEVYVGLIVIPCAYLISYTEWSPRESGKGLVADRSSDDGIDSFWLDIKPNEKNLRILPNGNSLVKAADHYLLIVDDETGEHQEAVFTLTSTQLSKSRKWNTMIAGRTLRTPKGLIRPPCFTYAYRITTKPESNSQGSWYGVTIVQHGDKTVYGLPGGRDLFAYAKNFRDLILTGERRAAAPVTSGDSHDGGSGRPGDDDIPF